MIALTLKTISVILALLITRQIIIISKFTRKVKTRHNASLLNFEEEMERVTNAHRLKQLKKDLEKRTPPAKPWKIY